MAYAAVISLKQTIHRLQNSSQTPEILQDAYKQLISLQEVLRRSDGVICSRRRRKRLNAFEEQITEAVHQIEDSLELDSKEVSEEITSFIEAATKMQKDFIQESNNPISDDDDDDDHGDEDPAAVPSRSIDYAKMVGLSDAFTEIKDHMIRIKRPDDFGVFSFLGRAGNGRSLVAKTIYDDERRFACGAWLRIGSTQYSLKQMLLNLIAQVVNEPLHQSLAVDGEEKLGQYLYSSLKGRRYVVVLDDVDDADIFVQLRKWLPEQDNGSRVFITTSSREIARFEERFEVIDIPVVWDELLSWSYIRLSLLMFGASVEASAIPLEYEEAGKKIAKNCRGLRIVLAKVILALLRSEKTLEFWLAADEDDPIFMVDDEISEASRIESHLQENDKMWANTLFDLSTLIDKVKEFLYPKRFLPKMGIVTFYGMAGIGKTTLIRKVFEDPSISHHFNHRAWVEVGPKYESREILIDILAQIYPDIDKKSMKGDAELVEKLCADLSDEKCLVVLDDLWSQEPVHCLKEFLPNIKGDLMATTRLLKVAHFGPCDRVYKVRFLNKEESWELLREKVFSDERCPPQLEKAGKKIAKNCDGLPLLILAVADLLSKVDKTLEYWNKVAEKKIPVIMNAQNEVSKVLLPNYESLPQHLKALFLYMGVFPQNHEIFTSKLEKLLFAEGFLEPDPSQTFEDFATKFLKELVDRTMVMDQQESSNLKTFKSCRLHSVYWHLSCNEARKNNFFLALDSYVDNNSKECIKRQRRSCIRRSVALGFKGVHNVMDSMSTSRALLCTGRPHQYPVPLCFGSRLLKVLDALAIRFYEFPVEVAKLIHLRYLALTCDGDIPALISKLWNLQFLIIKQHLRIKNLRDSSYLPKEIWDMKELKHLQVSGNKLPNPEGGTLLPNLTSLLEVSVHSCTNRVLKRIPNLKKLGIQIELSPDDKSDPFRNLNRVSRRLRKLESLKCVVVNPELGSGGIVPPAPRSMFPRGLKKLSLSGLGYPWEHMSIIGKLPKLQVLKLRCYAFQGPTQWEMDDYRYFPQLKFLSIEDADLVRWDFKTPSIYNLERLSIKHCYELEQLPPSLPGRVRRFEVVECNPLAENWAMQMKEENWEIRQMKTLEVDVQSSWNDEKLK